MTYDQAVKESQRMKLYFPYRIVGIINDGGNYYVETRKTMAKFNSLVKDGKEVFICQIEQ